MQQPRLSIYPRWCAPNYFCLDEPPIELEAWVKTAKTHSGAFTHRGEVDLFLLPPKRGTMGVESSKSTEKNEEE